MEVRMSRRPTSRQIMVLVTGISAHTISCTQASPTEVLVHMAPDQPVAEYSVTLTGPFDEMTNRVFTANDVREQSFGVAPKNDDVTRDVKVEITASFVAGGSVTLLHPIHQFFRGRSGDLYFFFASRCTNPLVAESCAPHTECSRCGCEDVELSPFASQPPDSWTGACTETCDGGVIDAGADGGSPTEFYVAAGGRSDAAGTLNDPWDLASALAQPPALRPGTKLWLLKGTYSGESWTSEITGTSDQPITIASYGDDRATIDAASLTGELTIAGGHTLWYGIEFTKSNAIRATSGGARGNFTVAGEDIRIIHCAIHDFGSVISGPNAPGGELTGNIIYNNGYAASPDLVEGDGLRVYNDPGTKLVRDNILFGNYAASFRAEHQLISTSTAEMRFERNIGCCDDAQFVAGGSAPVSHLSIVDNHFYQLDASSHSVTLGQPQGVRNRSALVSGNRLVGGSGVLSLAGFGSLTVMDNLIVGREPNQYLLFEELEDGVSRSSVAIDHNTYIRADGDVDAFLFRDGTFAAMEPLGFSAWIRTTGWDTSSRFEIATATTAEVFVHRSPIEPDRRENLVVYDWAGLFALDVDPNQDGQLLAPGDQYEVRFGLDYFGAPVAGGVYNGGTIRLPMTNSKVVAPTGDASRIARNPTPYFGVFVLKRK
jgi:hypothetical protein